MEDSYRFRNDDLRGWCIGKHTYQQMLATDRLLEYAEISLRTLCDLIRYQQLKELGIVHSAKEFIQLFHPNEQEDTP